MNEKKLMETFDRLNRKMRRYFSGYFADTSLTAVQALVLHYILIESEARDVFPKDLEEFLKIKPSSVTSLINHLERNGYLRRENLADDGRYKKLVLTGKTFTMKDEILCRVDNYMKSMFVGISDEDLQVFEKVLLQMTANIE